VTASASLKSPTLRWARRQPDTRAGLLGGDPPAAPIGRWRGGRVELISDCQAFRGTLAAKVFGLPGRCPARLEEAAGDCGFSRSRSSLRDA